MGLLQRLVAGVIIVKTVCDRLSLAVGVVARGVLAEDGDYLSRLGAWNLDTGLDENGRLVFWE